MWPLQSSPKLQQSLGGKCVQASRSTTSLLTTSAKGHLHWAKASSMMEMFHSHLRPSSRGLVWAYSCGYILSSWITIPLFQTAFANTHHKMNLVMIANVCSTNKYQPRREFFFLVLFIFCEINIRDVKMSSITHIPLPPKSTFPLNAKSYLLFPLSIINICNTQRN